AAGYTRLSSRNWRLSSTMLPCSSFVTSAGSVDAVSRSSLYILCERSVKYRMLAGEVAPRSRMHSPSCDDQYRASSPSPLERRESLGWLCAGDEVLSAPDDGPRNSFMQQFYR